MMPARPSLKRLALLALTACLVAGGVQARGKAFTADEKAKCLAGGGSVAIMGLSGDEGCIHPMPDAGKPCTDGSQCKAGCFLESARPSPKDKQPGAKVTGSCARTDSIFGCRTAVVDGKPGPSLCVD